MPRSAGTSVENSFVGGIVTEATGLNFPENAVTESFNTVFNKDGTVNRRLGIDYEEDFVISEMQSAGVTQAYKWESVGVSGNRSFIVVQIGGRIYFYQITSGSLSSTLKSFQVNLFDHKCSVEVVDDNVENNKASFASGLGYLFIAHRHCNPMYVKYDSEADDIIVTEVTIMVRDFEGIDDGLDVGDRPSTLSLAHEYNLQNQGWKGPTKTVANNSDGPIRFWDVNADDFPSNADIPWVMRRADGELSMSFINNKIMGNTPAAKGHYIYDAFNMEKAVVHDYARSKPPSSLSSGTTTVVETVTSGLFRPSTVAFFSGRVWWSGIFAEKYYSKIYFSKIIESDSDFGKCYQQNDPAAEYLSDLLGSDGGVVTIPDATSINFIKNIGNAIFAFASNGVWSVSGEDFSGFSADGFQVKKMSEVGSDSTFSFVSADGNPFWWTTDGIFSLVQDGNSFSVVSITDKTFKRGFEAIPNRSKLYAQGVWNKLNKTLSWIYSSENDESIADNFRYDRELVFNLETNAFYIHSFYGIPKICAVVGFSGTSVVQVTEAVTSSSVVVTSSSDPVTVTRDDLTNYVSGNKYLTVVDGDPSDFTWAEFRDDTYVDFKSHDDIGENFSSYFVSGYRLRGESMRDFQNNYLTITSRVEEGSGFLVSGRWDYAFDESSNRFTTKQQGYFPDGTRTFTSRKLKIRGSGKVLQYKVESQVGKPFNIAGWVVYDTVGSSV